MLSGLLGETDDGGLRGSEDREVAETLSEPVRDKGKEVVVVVVVVVLGDLGEAG